MKNGKKIWLCIKDSFIPATGTYDDYQNLNFNSLRGYDFWIPADARLSGL